MSSTPVARMDRTRSDGSPTQRGGRRVAWRPEWSWTGRAVDTALLSALLLGIAVFFGFMAVFPGPSTEAARVGDQIRAWRSGRVAGAAELIGKARLELSPRTLIAITIVGPLALGLVGLLVSPIVALIGLGV